MSKHKKSKAEKKIEKRIDKKIDKKIKKLKKAMKKAKGTKGSKVDRSDVPLPSPGST